MAQLHLTDEVLMAFADGELDDPVAATVEQAMADNPAIARRVTEFLRSRRLVRSAFPEEMGADVPPELLAGVQARIASLEQPMRAEAGPEVRAGFRLPVVRTRTFGMALAAGIACLLIGAAGYLVGRQIPSSAQLAGPIAQLSDPRIGRILSESRSGQERDLPYGRIRVVSTFRLADRTLCREFRLQTASGGSNAVACRNGRWRITFAMEEATGAYVPSGGDDLMESYLQNAGAGQPLLDAAEIEALRDVEHHP